MSSWKVPLCTWPQYDIGQQLIPEERLQQGKQNSKIRFRNVHSLNLIIISISPISLNHDRTKERYESRYISQEGLGL